MSDSVSFMIGMQIRLIITVVIIVMTAFCDCSSWKMRHLSTAPLTLGPKTLSGRGNEEMRQAEICEAVLRGTARQQGSDV